MQAANHFRHYWFPKQSYQEGEVKSGSGRECFEFSSVWKQDLKFPEVVVTAAIRRYTVIPPLLGDWTYDCGKTKDAGLMYYLQKNSRSKQPMRWWHGFQCSDNLQIGWWIGLVTEV